MTGHLGQAGLIAGVEKLLVVVETARRNRQFLTRQFARVEAPVRIGRLAQDAVAVLVLVIDARRAAQAEPVADTLDELGAAARVSGQRARAVARAGSVSAQRRLLREFSTHTRRHGRASF